MGRELKSQKMELAKTKSELVEAMARATSRTFSTTHHASPSPSKEWKPMAIAVATADDDAAAIYQRVSLTNRAALLGLPPTLVVTLR